MVSLLNRMVVACERYGGTEEYGRHTYVPHWPTQDSVSILAGLYGVTVVDVQRVLEECADPSGENTEAHVGKALRALTDLGRQGKRATIWERLQESDE